MTAPAGPKAGRRVAARRGPRFLGAGVTPVVVLLLAVGAVLLAGARHPRVDRPASATGQPVTDVLTACPQGSATAQILTGSIPLPALGGSGTLSVAPLAGAATKTAIQRGVLTTLPAAGKATVVDAAGPAAAGHFGVLVDHSHGALAALRCSPPRSTWWFTGAAGTLDHGSRLLVANVDPGPAVVDVRVLGEQGPVDTVGTRGITLAPDSVRTFSLTGIAPKGQDLAVEVRASRGRVVAAVADSYAVGPGAPVGSDWLPDQRVPSRVVRIAAVPQGSRPTLLLTNPSSLTALVGMRVEGPNGIFTPTQHAQVQVPAHSTRAVDISPAVGHETAGLLLRSRVPVVATVRSLAAGDSLHAAAVRPLEDAAAAAWPPGVRSRLLLTAGALPATASVAAYDERGHRLAGTVLHLAPGSTVSWRPPGHAGYLTVTPGDGAVHGAVVLTGSGVAEVPLEGLPIRVERPVVRPGPVGYSSSP